MAALKDRAQSLQFTTGTLANFTNLNQLPKPIITLKCVTFYIMPQF